MKTLKSVDASELSLVPDLIIPSKFKVPKIEKYDGIEFPETHLVAYYQKISGHTRNEKLLIHVFQESLAEATTKWYL